MDKSINFLCHKRLLRQELEFRIARESDVAGIFQLLDYYHERGFVKKITREQILEKNDKFFVAVSKDVLVACICLQLFFEEKKAFISSVAVSPDFTNLGVGTEMEKLIERSVKRFEIDKMLLVSKNRKDWWTKRGFVQSDFGSLPEKIRAEYPLPVNTVLSKLIKKGESHGE